MLGGLRPRLGQTRHRGRHRLADLGTANLDDSPAPRTPADSSSEPTDTQRDRTGYAHQLWAASFRIDQEPDHPVRRWVARRGLYWPAPVPLPSCIRWLPAGLLSQQHQGAGAIVAAFAPHDEWAERWPHLPNPTCIELVHLDAEGLPALDKPAEEGGLGKRSYGIRQGAVCLLGDPRPASCRRTGDRGGPRGRAGAGVEVP